MKKLMCVLFLLVGCGPTVMVEEPPPCDKCSDAIYDHEKVYNTCEDSLQRYGALYACVCDPLHLEPFPCQEWCGGGEISNECLIGVMENKCFQPFMVCDSDK